MVIAATSRASAYSQIRPDEQAARDAVARYHSGLMESDSMKVRSALANGLFMFNGNYSDDQTRWQAHLYLTGESLQRWASQFISFAAPHKNQLRFLNVHLRGNAAVVVTSETGSNKFRTWNDERVVYQVGKKDGEWKIVGFFIKDIKNPE